MAERPLQTKTRRLQEEQKEQKMKWIMRLVGVGLVLVLLGGGIWFSHVQLSDESTPEVPEKREVMEEVTDSTESPTPEKPTSASSTPPTSEPFVKSEEETTQEKLVPDPFDSTLEYHAGIFKHYKMSGHDCESARIGAVGRDGAQGEFYSSEECVSVNYFAWSIELPPGVNRLELMYPAGRITEGDSQKKPMLTFAVVWGRVTHKSNLDNFYKNQASIDPPRQFLKEGAGEQPFPETVSRVTMPEEKRKITVVIRVEDASETHSVKGEIGQFRLSELR